MVYIAPVAGIWDPSLGAVGGGMGGDPVRNDCLQGPRNDAKLVLVKEKEE